MKAHAGKMVEFVKEEVAQATDAKDREELHTIVLAVSAEANLPAQRQADRSDAAAIQAGRSRVQGVGLGVRPVPRLARREAQPRRGEPRPRPHRLRLAAVARRLHQEPAAPAFYPGDKNDRMPLYGEQKILDERSIGLIADWIRGDAGGEPDSAGAAAEPTAVPAATAQTAPATNPAAAPTTAPTTLPAPAPSTAPASSPDLAPAPDAAPNPPRSETMPTVPETRGDKTRGNKTCGVETYQSDSGEVSDRVGVRIARAREVKAE